MLAIFLVGLGAFSFSPKWLAHELDHDRQTLEVLTDHDHAPQPDSKGGPNPEPLSNTEHELLHSACHLQPLLFSSILCGFGESPARTTLMLSRLLPLPTAEIEPPFRPPRTTSRI